jgi:hypothetical protein
MVADLPNRTGADAPRASAGRSRICKPPDPWGARALIAWVSRLGGGNGSFDPDVQQLVEVAEVLDRIYGRTA